MPAQFKNLALDIRDYLLTCLPDFETLRSAVLASRGLHEAYVLRSKSIMHCVVSSEIGPAWPFALVLARMRDEPWEGCTDGLIVNDWIEDSQITGREAFELIRVSKIAKQFEDMFSNREKDRTSKTSVLSDAESYRFQRALYKLWWIREIYAADGEDNLDRPEYMQHCKVELLGADTLTELLELDRVWHFLADIVKWLRLSHGPTEDDDFQQVLMVKPESFLEAYETFDFGIILDDSQDAPNPVLREFLEDRGVEPGCWIDSPDDAVLVDEILGEDDTCDKCNAEEGLNLWGEPNWSWLRGHLPPDRLPAFLPGYLGQNFTTKAELVNLTKDKGFRYEEMIKEMFEGQIDTEEYKTDGWYCWTCLTQFFKKELYSWFVNWKRKEGHVFQPEDCWYGWNCRTQRHKLSHASRLNHFCAPTRGDQHDD
ncbi:hypothetical protein BD410DRAFT_893725 [Rickenella mellea]|uniref:Aprataxin and PNK-like factor PBZ domain-containing protein n=1 Tax=Rickenella mellea TaxID=50990 RepID=A0A4Y7QN24_9AGAM|nr:hypothetical protein BD410DRAFT_893725 [Rickenella mellea]